MLAPAAYHSKRDQFSMYYIVLLFMLGLGYETLPSCFLALIFSPNVCGFFVESPLARATTVTVFAEASGGGEATDSTAFVDSDVGAVVVAVDEEHPIGVPQNGPTLGGGS